MQEAGTLPEMEVFDCGHLHNATPFIDMGLLKPPYVFSFVMGVMGGIPATTENLVHQARSVPPGSHWQVIGIGRRQWALIAVALTSRRAYPRRAGRQLLPSLRAKWPVLTGELVEAAVRLARMLGREPATLAETRAFLNLPPKP